MRLKWGRIIWVLAVNGIAIYLAVYGSPEVRRLRSFLVSEQPLGPSWQDYLRGVIPAVGILFETLGLRIAKYVNIGYFGLLTVIWGVFWIYSRHDLEAAFYSAGFFFFALIVTLVNLRLYRTRPAVLPSTS